ncbi:P-loop NTPase [Candidatus Woesearchaeota archaeon]|nr:P-loop NTPase [Candidatus Woesearchaeota archaeon]
MTKIIAIVSGKGGTGKTTVAINLALAMNEFGHNVILLDADLRSADIGLLLGVPPSISTLHDALAGQKNITEVVYHHPSGLNFIPGSIAARNMARVDLQPILSRLRGTVEIIIMDLPAGLHQEVFSLLRIADEAIIVTNPELPAVTDALKTIALVEQESKVVRGVVVNRYGPDSMPLGSIQEMLDQEILGVVPEDDYVKRSVQVKYPVTYAYPLAPASASFKNIAASLLGKRAVH